MHKKVIAHGHKLVRDSRQRLPASDDFLITLQRQVWGAWRLVGDEAAADLAGQLANGSE